MARRLLTVRVMARAHRTIDHDTIKQWVEGRGGHPAHVTRSGSGEDPGILRIDYPGYSGEDSLERIGWDEWLKAFDANGLAFLYQEERDSRFSKLVRRNDEDGPEQEAGAEGAGGGGSQHAGKPARPRRENRWQRRTSPVTLDDASAEELDALYGVGPAIARRIVQHRRKHGRLRGTEDLVAIDGIDRATARQIAEQIDFG